MAHGGAAAVAAAIANAIKASGLVVRVEPEDFVNILRKAEKLIVSKQGGVFSKNHQYLTSYKGFAFFTKSREQIDLSRGVEIVHANKIWIPQLDRIVTSPA
jgi:ethanolamine utilization protein EutA (predicted chaperonin)